MKLNFFWLSGSLVYQINLKFLVIHPRRDGIITIASCYCPLTLSQVLLVYRPLRRHFVSWVTEVALGGQEEGRKWGGGRRGKVETRSG